MIEVQELSKRYGEKLAVDGLNFTTTTQAILDVVQATRSQAPLK